MEITAQLIGFAGIIVNALIYQQSDRASILKIKLTSDVLWAAHFSMLGAYSAAAVACIGILREFVFMKRKKLSSLIFFLILSFVSAALTWKGPASILPSAASAASVVSFYIGNSLLTRLLSFPISACMGMYSAMNGSIAGIVNELLTVASSAAALFIYRKQRKKLAESALQK